MSEGFFSGLRSMVDARSKGWNQAGNLWLWRYRQNTRNYPGWNLAGDQLGWDSVFVLLGQMTSSPWACEWEISANRPTARVLAVPNNPGGSEGLESPPCLRLEVPRRRVGDRHWRLEANPERLTLELGPSKLTELRAAVGSIPSTGGDFAIGPDDRTARKETSLWLWRVPEM